MAKSQAITDTDSTIASAAEHGSSVAPRVRKIQAGALFSALRLGLDDFLAKPSHVVFLVLIYPLFGLFLARMTFGYNVLPMLFPLMAGLAIIGPFAAIGLYELSRRRELGLEITWRNAFDVFRSPCIRSIGVLGVLLVAIFLAWLIAAQLIYVNTMGDKVPVSIAGFLDQLFSTRSGMMLILVGNAVGFLFAVVALAVSVVSFPLIIHRNVNPGVAIQTSIKACTTNPFPMALWGMIVAGLLAIGSLPAFAGLAIILPVLGHATWHLYRKVVD